MRSSPASALLATLALALCVPLACQGTDTAAEGAPPAWVDRPYDHPTCDRRLYLCGVGSAAGVDESARDLSRRRALEDVVASIVVEVSSVIQLDSVTHRKNDQVFWVEELAESIRLETTPEDLPGAELVDVWRSTARHETWALVSVRRDLLLDTYLPEVERALASASELLAPTAGGDADPAREFRRHLTAYQALADAYGQATRAKVVGAPAPFGRRAAEAFARTSELMAQASARLAGLFSAVRVEALEGDGQTGSFGMTLAEPVRARLLFVGSDGTARPLVDMPVSCETDPTGAATFLPAVATSDAAGEVAVLVTDLAPTGQGSNTILLRPDVAGLAPDLADTHVPAARFGYRLPTPASTRVLLSVAEVFEQGTLPEGTLAEQLADHLSGYGFDAATGRDRGLSSADLAGLAPAELRTRLGPDVDVVVRGSAHVRISSRERQLVWFRASAELQIIELATGRSTSLATGEVKQAATGPDASGALRALRHLQPVLTRRLDETFVSAYVPGVADP